MARRVSRRVMSAINGVDVAKIGLALPRWDGCSLNFEAGAPAATDRRAKDAMRVYSTAWQDCCDSIPDRSVRRSKQAFTSIRFKRQAGKQEQE
jgi:hypothetical protein